MRDSEVEDNEIAELTEQEMCYSCLGVNDPGVNFCQHCRTPLTSFAATGPLERAYALGDFARKGVNHPKATIRWTVWILVWVLLIMIGFGMMVP
jgi:hypothetical protein